MGISNKLQLNLTNKFKGIGIEVSFNYNCYKDYSN